MRTVRIFLVGTVALITALLIDLWARWAALAIAFLPFAFIATGQFFLPRSKQSIRLWLDPCVLEDLNGLSLKLSGRQITLDFFKRWYDFEIQPHNLWLLAGLALLSLGTSAMIWATHELPMPSAYLYYAGSTWSLVCYLSWRWLWERKVMRKSGFALGSFRLTKHSPLLKRVIYHFTDQEGGHRGGTVSTLSCSTEDDLTVIFYDEDNPEYSVPASAMMFHKLRWSDAAVA